MAITPLSQAVLQGMDPNIYRPLGYMKTGDELFQQGSDSSPTSKWGAIGRLAQALSGTYLQNSATSDLAKTIAGGKKSASDQLMEALQSQKAAVPSAPPAISSPPAPAMQPSVPQTSAPVPVDPGSPNAQVANRFPAEMSPGSAASPLPNNAQSPLDTAAYPAGPMGTPSEVAATNPVAGINAAAQPRGIRNNNPLNIEAGDFTKSQPGFAGSDGRVAKFETPEHGVAAANALLDTYEKKHGLNTVAGIVNRWAPPSDGNNTMAYASDVAGKLGIDPNAPIPPAMRPQLIAAMAQHENGKAAPGTAAAPVQLASAAPQTANDADPELPANAAPTQGQQVAEAGHGGGAPDVHRLMAVMQNPYADDATKALASKLIMQQLGPSEFGVIGEDSMTGAKKYGWINSARETTSSASGEGGSGNPLSSIDSSKTGDEYLKQFPPEIQSGVKDYLEGRRMPTGNPRRTDIVKQVASKYGNDIGMPADDASFSARRTMLNDLNKTTPGSIGGQITFARTSLNHLGEVAKNAEALGNWDTGISPISAGVNYLRGLTTDQASKVAALQDAAQHYGQEVTKFYAGSPGGEGERTRFLTALNGAKSPKELAAVIESERNLIPGRMSEVENRIKNTLGPAAEKYPVQSQESKASTDAIDKVVGRMRGVAPAAEAAGPTAGAAPDRSAIEAEMRKRGLLQ